MRGRGRGRGSGITLGGELCAAGGIEAGDVAGVAEVGGGEGGDRVGEASGIVEEGIGAREVGELAGVRWKGIGGRGPPGRVHLHVCGIHGGGGGPPRMAVGKERRGIRGGKGGGQQRREGTVDCFWRRKSGPREDGGVGGTAGD